MSERGINANTAEANRLYTRGVAAAKAGQRRVAASLLSRAVQYDPAHEQAWLWLAGVLDDPNEVAFCLRSALHLNPNNQRARDGLAWLEVKQKVTPVAPSAPPAPPSAQLTPETAPETGWWIRFRQQRRELNRAWLMVWVSLLTLWLLLWGLNYALRETIASNNARMEAALATALPVPTSIPTSTPRPLIAIAPDGGEHAEILAYLSAIEPVRAELRTAVDAYRATTQQPGSVVIHAAAARTLRDRIEAIENTLRSLQAPAVLQDAHDAYLGGLEQERAAMSDLLDFFGSYSVELSNRAVLRLLDADAQIVRARTEFEQTQQLANQLRMLPYTIR